jgi:hypothetical protein
VERTTGRRRWQCQIIGHARRYLHFPVKRKEKPLPKNYLTYERKVNKLVLTCPTPVADTRVLLEEEGKDTTKRQETQCG